MAITPPLYFYRFLQSGFCGPHHSPPVMPSPSRPTVVPPLSAYVPVPPPPPSSVPSLRAAAAGFGSSQLAGAAGRSRPPPATAEWRGVEARLGAILEKMDKVLLTDGAGVGEYSGVIPPSGFGPPIGCICRAGGECAGGGGGAKCAGKNSRSSGNAKKISGKYP